MENKKMYVGNLNYGVTEEDLRELFTQYGNIESIRVINGKGFAFVEMSERKEMESAMESLNGQDFKGRTLRIDEARPRKENSFNRNRRR